LELYGIALLPEPEMRQKIVDFRGEYEKHVGGPKLGIDTNLPHMTILQCPYFPNAPHGDALRDTAERLSLGVSKSHFTSVEYQHVGWVFADIASEAWLAELQSACFDATLQFIDLQQINDADNFLGYTEDEKRNYLEYGYRYVGTSFRPHVTLGRSIGPEAMTLPPGLVEAFRDELGGSTVIFNELVFYRAGEFGALAEVLETVPLS
jgi:2'-5' RNA ligase